MTVTYLGIKPGSASGTNTMGVRSYQCTYLLKVDSQADGPYAVGSHPSLPRIGSTWIEDSGAWCRSLTINSTDGWVGWEAVAMFDSSVEVSENPVLDPTSIEWDGETYDEIITIDSNGHAALNSAGDPFVNLFRERSRRIVNVRTNITAVPLWIITAEDAVNDSAFLLDGFTIPTGMAKLGAPRLGAWQYRNGIRYREMTMTIKLNKDTWTVAPLDAGFRKYVGGVYSRITSDDGTDVTEPVCLDGSGDILANPTPATAVYASLDVYPSFDFNTLPLA